MLDLAPARWIWLPSQRCLHNTFIFFRRELHCPAPPARATGWLTADSRYRLTVNGRRVQWGPAPCDPRFQEADPVDLTGQLTAGLNVIGVEVCYFGSGDGTWPLGGPGFICNLELQHAGGPAERLVSDSSWLTCLDRAHRPGQFKRWFLRALQEEYDARLHPAGWDTPAFRPDAAWLPAMLLPGAANRPAIFASYLESIWPCDAGGTPVPAVGPPQLQARDIPLMRESLVPAQRLVDAGRVKWLRDPRDWFEFRVPQSFEISTAPVATAKGEDSWELPATPRPDEGVYLTFALPEVMAAWPRFTLEAPEGTSVELMTVEALDPVQGPRWLDFLWYHWTRFICREGHNEFETFDYESFKFLQLHVRNARRPVVVSAVGARRRTYAWPHAPQFRCAEPAVQRLFDATLNTLNNSAQETNQDGGARERQQYSGDVGHQIQAVRYVFGEFRQPARYLRTFSQGLTHDGFFLDCWPAWDRLARLAQRQLGLTVWGPILDHGVGFIGDCWQHYWDTGDRAAVEEPYPRLWRFAEYLWSRRGADGLLPVEDLGVPSVWLDHVAFKRQRHKQCAFNLYVAGAFQYALAPLCKVFGDLGRARLLRARGTKLLDGAITRFWCPRRRLFVSNLPWEAEENEARLEDRSLSHAILYDFCPAGETAPTVRALVECPPEMGFQYPANAGWRLLALCKAGRGDVVVNELRTRWAGMISIALTNTLQEDWEARPGTTSQFCHCPVAPAYVLVMGVLGLRAVKSGFAAYEVRPQLADLGALDVIAHTVRGPFHFVTTPTARGHDVELTVPDRTKGVLILPGTAPVKLRPGQAHRFTVEGTRLPIPEAPGNQAVGPFHQPVP